MILINSGMSCSYYYLVVILNVSGKANLKQKKHSMSNGPDFIPSFLIKVFDLILKTRSFPKVSVQF